MDTTTLSLSTHQNTDLQSLIEANRQLLRENQGLRRLLGARSPKTPARRKTAKPANPLQLPLFPPDWTWLSVPE